MFVQQQKNRKRVLVGVSDGMKSRRRDFSSGGKNMNDVVIGESFRVVVVLSLDCLENH